MSGFLDLEGGSRSVEEPLSIFQLAIALHITLAFFFLLALLVGNAVGAVCPSLVALFLIQTLVATIGVVAVVYRSLRLRYLYAFVNLLCGIAEFSWAVGFLVSRHEEGLQLKRVMLIALFIFQVSVSVAVFLFAEKALPAFCERSVNKLLRSIHSLILRLFPPETPPTNPVSNIFTGKIFEPSRRAACPEVRSDPAFVQRRNTPLYGANIYCDAVVLDGEFQAKRDVNVRCERTRSAAANDAHSRIGKSTLDATRPPGNAAAEYSTASADRTVKSESSIQTVSSHVPVVVPSAGGTKSEECSITAGVPTATRKRKEPGACLHSPNMFSFLRSD